MVFEGLLKGFSSSWRILIDSGATANFISRKSLLREEAAYQACEKQKASGPLKARLANGTLIDLDKETIKCEIAFLDFKGIEEFYVIDMNLKYDLILGIEWLRKHEPWINWSTNEMGNSRVLEEKPEVPYAERFVFTSEVESKTTDVLDEQSDVDSSKSNSLSDSESDKSDQLDSSSSGSFKKGRRTKRRLAKRKSQKQLLAANLTHVKSGDENKYLLFDPPVKKVAPSKTRAERIVAALEEAASDQVDSPSTALSSVGVEPYVPQFENDRAKAVYADLPTSAAELLLLDEMSFSDFLKELKAEEIEDIAIITPHLPKGNDQASHRECNSLADAKEETAKEKRFKEQDWEALKGNPVYPLAKKFARIFPDNPPAELPMD